MIQTEIPKSFVTTIRVNLIDIAKIALFLEKHDYKMNRKSRSKLASTGVHMAAAGLADYEIETTEQAIAILRQLNYGESLQAGRRDFKPMIKQMSKENIYLDTIESRPVIRPSQSKYYQKTNEAEPLMSEQSKEPGPCEMRRKLKAKEKLKLLSPNVPGIEEILVPAKPEAEPEAESEPEPKSEPEPEPESPQLKTRTANDEKKDILKLRTAMNDFSNAPVLEENKTGKD